MKNIYLFFIFFIIIACESKPNIEQSSKKVNCPPILFSAEHRNYIGIFGDNIKIDNIAYKSYINNSEFIRACEIKENIFSGEISILFLVNPVNEDKIINPNISLPFYIAFVNKNNYLKKIDYYFIDGILKENFTSNKFKETEILINKKIIIEPFEEDLSIIIGFMLDDQRLEIIN